MMKYEFVIEPLFPNKDGIGTVIVDGEIIYEVVRNGKPILQFPQSRIAEIKRGLKGSVLDVEEDKRDWKKSWAQIGKESEKYHQN